MWSYFYRHGEKRMGHLVTVGNLRPKIPTEFLGSVSCHLQFRVTDDITREDVLVTPAVYVQQRIPSHIARLIPARQASRELVDDDEGHQREEGDRADQGETPQREDLPKEGLQKVGPQKVEEHKDISDTEEWKRFRLISIPNLLSEVRRPFRSSLPL